MQLAFIIKVLPLKTQRIVDFIATLGQQFAVGAKMGRPHAFAIGIGEIDRGAGGVEVIIINLGCL